jgi:hypothetical protein
MALSMNQFGLSTLAGSKVQGEAIITGEFYSATGTDTVAPGYAVALASTVNGLPSKVAAGATASAAWVGVVLTNPLKDSFAVGEKVEVALNQCVVMMTASAAITAGAQLDFDPATGKVLTHSAGTVLGLALENAASANDLIRVLVKC